LIVLEMRDSYEYKLGRRSNLLDVFFTMLGID
jgi:hypothetical protein